MAAPAEQNLTIVRGDTETIVVTMTSDTGSAIDVTGRTYTAQLRTSPDIAIVAGSFVCSVTDGPNGQVTCVLSAANSALLDPGYYYWDLQENASGVITTVMSGTVQVLADVTR